MSMRITQTNSHLSSHNTIKYNGNQNAIRNGSNQNESKIFVSGTNKNKNQQTDTAKKPNSLEAMIEEIKTTAEDYGKYLTEKLKHDSEAARKFMEMLIGNTEEIEKFRETKAEQNQQEQGVEDTNPIKVSSETVIEGSEYVPIAAYRANDTLVNSDFDVKL